MERRTELAKKTWESQGVVRHVPIPPDPFLPGSWGSFPGPNQQGSDPSTTRRVPRLPGLPGPHAPTDTKLREVEEWHGPTPYT